MWMPHYLTTCMAGLRLLLVAFVMASCGAPLRVYTSPDLKPTQQRPQAIAIMPLTLVVSTTAGTGTTEQVQAGTGEAAMLQQMLYSILLQQARKHPLTLRPISPGQLPAGAAVLNEATARQLQADAFLVTRLLRTQTVYSTTASTVTSYDKAAATATSTSTPAGVGTQYDILLDVALYSAQGQLLWKYNNRESTWMSTPARVTERLMAEGLQQLPLRR